MTPHTETVNSGTEYEKELAEQGITLGLERLKESRNAGDLPETQQLLEKQLNERLDRYGDMLVYLGQVMIAEAEGELQAA